MQLRILYYVAMTIHELIRAGRLFTTEEAKRSGISPTLLSYYVKQGKLERLTHGIYLPADTTVMNPYQDIEELLLKRINFVVCLLSALRIHEFTTQNPSSLWIALPPGARVPQISSSPITPIHLSKPSFEFGVEYKELYGLRVPVFNPAKTVADCFKFRNKFGLDVALEALREGLQLRLFTIDELLEAARACRVERVITPYAMAILQ